MAYSIVLPDGAVVENIPDEVTPSDAKARIIAKLPQYGPKPEDQSIFRQVADLPLGIAKGIAQGARMGSDIFGAGSKTSQNIKGVEDYIAGFMSAQSKQDQQEIARIQKEAEDKGIWDQVKAGAKAFAVAPIDTLSSAVGTAVPAILAGTAATGVGAPLAVATGIGTLIRAGMGTGTIKGSIYEATKQALEEAGASPQEAEQKAIQAQEYGGKNLDQILLGTLIGGVAGAGPLEKGAARLIANKISNKVATETSEAAAKGAVRKRIEAGVLESVPEALQAGQERVAQNIALQREGMDVPTFRGAVGAATLEGLAGAGLGAAIGGSGYKQDLVEGQREGETLRQAAERTQQELLDLQAMRSEQAAADQQAAQAAAQTGISSLLGGIEPTRQQRPSVQSPAAFNNLLAQAAEVAPQDQGIQVLLKAAASNSRSATESPANFNSLLAQTALTESPIEKGIASMLAAPETRAMPSRTASPAAFDTLLAPEITPLPPAAPPEMDPGLMDILKATGGQGPSRVQSPSIANNLLAAEPVPEAPPAPPVMDPGLAKILQAIGGQGESRTQSPNIANNLLAATPEPETPPAPPVTNPGLAEILKAIGSPQTSRVKSPSVANNLLAAEPAPEAPPVAVPGMSNILKATGQQAQSRVNSPLSATNLLTPEPIDASTEAEPGATQADVGQTTGAGVPVAGQPAVPTTTGVKQPKPKPGGLAVPQPNVERPIGGAGALPTPIATPEQSSLTAASKTPAQQEALGTAEVTFPHSQIVGTVDTQLQQLTNFVNTQGESITAPNTKTTPPLIAKARSLHKSLLNEGMSLVDGVHRNFLGEADATPQKVSELQRKVADRVEEAEAFSKQAPKKSLASEGEAVPSPEEQDASLNTQIEAKTKEFGNILTKIMSNMGMRDVAINLVSNLKGANAEYANRLIRLAIDAQSPVRDLRHESIHAMKELGFFSDKQWATLEKMANDKWIKQYLGDVNIDQQPLEAGEQSRLDAYQEMFKTQGLSDQEAQQALVEEAIADAFGTFDVQGAPAGLLSAILKRMQSLFEAIKTAFGGAETAEQIFQKAEKGKLQGAKPNAPKEAEQPEQPEEPEEPKASLRRAAVPDETQISTQNPQGVTRKYDPIEQMLSIDQKAVEEAMEANPEMYNAITNAILRYGFIPTDTKPEDAISLFKKNIVNNLLFLHDAVPKDIANRSKLWYDGAHKIAKEMGKQYDMTLEQVSGIFAAMSPQKDWFQNVSMGERAIDILKNQGDASWDDNMLKYAESYIREPKDRKEREKRQIFFDKYIRSASKSKTLLKDMDAKTAAAFIRAFDEAYHSRQYRIVTPEGGFGDLVRNNDGKPSTMMWSTYGPIEKAVSIFRDRSRKNISEQLGAEHKIRSFYNNIAAPNADIDHVTIDTHAVAAALFEALAGTDTAVTENFGGTGKSSVLGVGGTYGIIADAYREAAKARGVQAREMQSITWEAIRGLFTEELKSGIKPKVRAEWDKYRAGEQSFNEARDAIVEIASKGRQEGKADWKNPDWIDSGPGQTVVEGGASYDKDFEPEGGVRLREESELREKVTFNLSAVTSTIPGLKDLYQKAMSGDQGAYAALQKAAESSLKYLLSGTSATVKVEYAKGVFLSDKEPSLSVSAAFKEADRMAVLAALERFANNYNQEQIHVRQPTAYKVGHQFDDRSYATPVYTIDLAKDLSNAEIDNVIDKSGLIAFTIAPLKTKTGTINQLIAYWCKQNDQSREEQSNDFDQFKSKVLAAQQLAGVSGARPKQTVERLYAYGRGDTATHGYERIKGDVYPKQGSDTETPRIIADYLLGEEGKTFPPKKLNKFQVVSQRLLSDVFDALPINDLKTPIVRKAYNALNVELVRQFEVLPVKVEAVDSKTEPYKDSAAMREDVSQNNRLKVYKTQADTFGPEGVPMGDHPLLEESGLVDYKGTPLLYNDLLRAVHDYYAHGVTPAEFGPKGEASAWLNHMASTMSPLARWAITAETRAQNAWTNFRPGAEEMLLKDRGFSLQKAALPPVQFALTGDEKVDAPMQEFIAKLTPKQQLGSLSPKNPLAKKIGPATKAKFSIRAPDTKEFKQWFGKSTIVDANGNPRVMYHGTARDITSFRAKQANAIFVTDEPTLAENYAYASADWMAKNEADFFTPEEKAAARRQVIESLQEQNKSLPKSSKDFNKQVIAYLKTGDEDAASDVKDYAKEALLDVYVGEVPRGANILPVFVKAENPFDYDNAEHIAKLEKYAKDRLYTSDSIENYIGFIKNGSWEDIESNKVQKAIRSLGFDGFYVKEGGVKNLAVYNPEQIKSATGNQGTFDINNPDIRKSLRSTLPRALMQRIDQTTTARKDEGHVGRMINAISPGKHTTIRAELLNRYDALDRLDKIRIQQMGGAAAMADISSESAALLSDLGAGITASALGVHDKVGGAPVYVQSYYVVRNGTILPRRYKTRAQAQAVAGANGEVRSGGHTAVGNFNNTVKGPLAIFAPLAKMNDPDIYRLYQFWAAAKRGKRFDKEGREFLLEPADQQHAADLERRFPEFVNIQKEWTKYNDKLVQYMVDTGVLTPEKGKIYTQYSDYIPFYRQVEGERTAGPNVFAAISSVKAPKEAKGSKAPLDDFLETIVRNTQSAVQAGVKNIAAQRAVEAAKDVGLAVKLPAGNGLPSTVTVLENGVPTHYDCKDALFVNAMKSLGMSEIPFLNIISAPANWLRAAVTKEPTFMLANLLRDSLSSYVTSGVKMTPVVDTMKNFAKTVVGMSPEYDILRRAGVVGGYDYTQGVEVSGRKFGEQLKKAAGVKSKGLKRVGKVVASPVTGIWNLLEKGSEASDAATRQEIYKKTLAETGNETEALFRSLEVMNFNRKGRNAGVRLFTAMIPFLNARMQGLDILYRTAVRPSLPGQSVSAREKELQHTFMVRGATMAALSCMYWMMTNDDDEYKKQEEDTKDNFWLIPSLGVKIPTPFEVGFLFKIIPERIMALTFGDDTFEDFRNSMTNQIVSTLKVNPIPQAVLPALENLVNVSAYTMRPIVSPGLEGLEAGYQVSPNTTTLMADIGKAVGMSPIKLEHAIQGYTGQMGMYLVSLLDAVYDINSTTPRPAKQFEKLPMIKRFAVDPNARGSVTTFYKLKDEVDTAVKTLNMLERTGNIDEYEAYFTENANLLATKEYVQQLANDMKDLAEMKAMIRSSEESAEEKGAALLEVQQMENDLTANIKELRQMARSKD